MNHPSHAKQWRPDAPPARPDGSEAAESEQDLRYAEALEASLAATQRQIDDLRRYGATLEQRHQELLASTAWQATAPLRGLVRMLRRKAPPPDFAPRLSTDEPHLATVQLEVKRAVHHLWGGSSAASVAALARILGDPDYPESQRFQAGQKLATWYAFLGQTDSALATLAALDRAAPSHCHVKERWMKEGFLRLAAGDREAARRAFARVGAKDPDAGLAMSNCLADDEARLQAISSIFARAGLATLRRADPDQPLALANIVAEAPPCRIGAAGLVSILVPAYNAAAELPTAIGSLKAQSYREIEIIIVDDASTDATHAVAQRLAAGDARIRVLRHETNAGAYPARNTGLAAANGAFVTTHDTDDWSHPEKIERMLAHLRDRPGLVGACCNWTRVRSDLTVTPNWRLGRRVIFLSHSSFLVRREVIDALGPWDAVRVGADTELIRRIEIVHGADAIGRVLPDVPLAFARDDAGSLTRTRATHVRSVHYGLRQIYHAVARAEHCVSGGVGTKAAARRHAALPPEMFGPAEDPVALHLLLVGDGTDPAAMRAMAAQIDAGHADHAGDPAGRIGIFHWPDFSAPPRELCAEYCALLQRPGTRAILPGARVRLGTHWPVFFTADPAPADDPPQIVT